ncbi:hypothetical protein LY474_08805 [Myxococcus stipitatus]|uniref:hypothetical protein n=1 Tax=Myxococcus stipitatus TaxID=83455 RepID=UPI001F23ECD7|nr:hypothetical protein [Myxococcus stipitatus]MCE9667908.1 hypothetical protein [Myxococcus stipitatus]
MRSLVPLLLLLASTGAWASVPCNGKWSGKVCAQETYLSAQWTETLDVSASAGQPPDIQVLVPAWGGEVVDLEMTVWTEAGDGGVAGLIDLELLAKANPTLWDAPELLAACEKGLSPDCRTLFANRVTLEQLQAATLWGHACKGARDVKSKRLESLKLESPLSPILEQFGARYVFVAKAEAGSSARLKAVVHHRSRRSVTEKVCGPIHSGSFTQQAARGVTLPLGDFRVDVAPKYGGTLSNVRLEAFAANALGVFSLSTTTPGQVAALTFQGDTEECAPIMAIIPNNRLDFWRSRPMSLYPLNWEVKDCQLQWIPNHERTRTERRCYRSTHLRPVVPLSRCAEGERNGALCYPTCKGGFHGAGPVCWQDCPAGYTDDGATCRRDAYIFGADNSKCPWYDKCGLTLAPGCSTCPEGYTTDGCTCRRDVHIFGKESYTRGAGFPMTCQPGEQQLGALCYRDCEAGFQADGVSCAAREETCVNVPIEEPPDPSLLRSFYFKASVGQFCATPPPITAETDEQARKLLECWAQSNCSNCAFQKLTAEAYFNFPCTGL